ncbi:unnamed protein product [Phytophthora lilii]|uniref:Unnamed protein product n=1 Tax=Phytophthora lilii TaxID=2077276 RepID=A0A9W6WMR4_9STRA|nr:unnamed protein product [Phytophthora lilii]
MPKRIPWTEEAVGVTTAKADAYLDTLKSFEILARETQTCLACDEVSIYTVGEHLAEASSPKKKKMNATQKAFCRELADNHLRPMRIRLAMGRRFETALGDLPALNTVQNFVNHYSRTHLTNNDRVDDVRNLIHTRAFPGDEEMTEAFTFRWDLDRNDKPVVDNGSDERPFLVGLTTKALVVRMMLPPDRFTLHVDATYKMNYRDYFCALLNELSHCCEEQSCNQRSFEFNSVPQQTLVHRVSDMLRAKLARGAGWILGTGCVLVVSRQAKRIYVAPNQRPEDGIAVSAQMGTSYARMEVAGQPRNGWVVNVVLKKCPCSYRFAFGTCVHIVVAIRGVENLDVKGNNFCQPQKAQIKE